MCLLAPCAPRSLVPTVVPQHVEKGGKRSETAPQMRRERRFFHCPLGGARHPRRRALHPIRSVASKRRTTTFANSALLP